MSASLCRLPFFSVALVNLPPISSGPRVFPLFISSAFYFLPSGPHPRVVHLRCSVCLAASSRPPLLFISVLTSVLASSCDWLLGILVARTPIISRLLIPLSVSTAPPPPTFPPIQLASRRLLQSAVSADLWPSLSPG